MAAIKDQMICIRKVDYSESSQIVTFFGRCSGKVSLIAKGSRRDKGKFDGAIDLLTAGELVFTPPREGQTVGILTEFALQEEFAGLRGELLRLHGGEYLADLVGAFTEESDPHEKLYDQLYQALQDLQKGQRPEVVLLKFEKTLLEEIGLGPAWQNCSRCGKAVEGGGKGYFSSDSGGLLCRNCHSGARQKHLVEPAVLKLLQNPTAAAAADRQAVIAAHELLSMHLRHLQGKESAIMKFVNQLLRRAKVGK